MSSKVAQLAQLNGFREWCIADKTVTCHEKSAVHRQCILDVCNRRKKSSLVDAQLKAESLSKKKYWIDVLRRVVAVIKFLAVRGLPFRGDSETIGSKHNETF